MEKMDEITDEEWRVLRLAQLVPSGETQEWITLDDQPTLDSLVERGLVVQTGSTTFRISARGERVAQASLRAA